MKANAYRDHLCGELRPQHESIEVLISGWLHNKRDHGNLLFCDIRDHSGICQCVIESGHTQFAVLEKLSLESVVSVRGGVVARSQETCNPSLDTGYIEVVVQELAVLSEAESLPIHVALADNNSEYPEELRLKYRYLDLRRPQMQHNILLRSRVIQHIRNAMLAQDFVEIHTPILTASSPEGARDYVIPSRLHHGKFYALPQAPQQFKQLLMISGFPKYFQISPCFRDEDARSDRSPGEFYQLDLEMSFVSQEDVFEALEPVLYDVFKTFGNTKTTTTPPFPRIDFKDAMLLYGTDKPDLRNPLIIQDVSSVFASSEFRVFREIVSKGGYVRVIKVVQGAKQSRSFFDKLNNWARSLGQAGLGYISYKNNQTHGPIASNLSAEELNQLQKTLEIQADDALFFMAHKDLSSLQTFASQVRDKLGQEFNLIEKDVYRFCWIVNYPMYEWSETTNKLEFSHNPFSMPQGGMDALNNLDPLNVLAYQYDIVCNGVELSSGAIRNHRPDIMLKAFAIAGYTQEDVQRRFAGMFNALKYGAPPHGGSAPGIERIVMLLADTPNIREITPFPLNQSAQDLLLNAPSTLDPQHLKLLNLAIVSDDDAENNE